MFRQTALSAKKKFPRVRVAAAAGRQGVFLFAEGAPGERRPFLTNGKNGSGLYARCHGRRHRLNGGAKTKSPGTTKG